MVPQIDHLRGCILEAYPYCSVYRQFRILAKDTQQDRVVLPLIS
jgi:hypothetical protein